MIDCRYIHGEDIEAAWMPKIMISHGYVKFTSTFSKILFARLSTPSTYGWISWPNKPSLQRHVMDVCYTTTQQVGGVSPLSGIFI